MGPEGMRYETPEQVLAREVQADRQKIKSLLDEIAERYKLLSVTPDMQHRYRSSRRVVANIHEVNRKYSKSVELSVPNRNRLIESLKNMRSIQIFFGEDFKTIGRLFDEIDEIDAKRDWHSY